MIESTWIDSLMPIYKDLEIVRLDLKGKLKLDLVEGYSSSKMWSLARIIRI